MLRLCKRKALLSRPIRILQGTIEQLWYSQLKRQQPAFMV